MEEVGAGCCRFNNIDKFDNQRGQTIEDCKHVSKGTTVGVLIHLKQWEAPGNLNAFISLPTEPHLRNLHLVAVGLIHVIKKLTIVNNSWKS
jgi:hypothetical protein